MVIIKKVLELTYNLNKIMHCMLPYYDYPYIG
jgi:hypothetical protein